jgi:hypothetical protein
MTEIDKLFEQREDDLVKGIVTPTEQKILDGEELLSVAEEINKDLELSLEMRYLIIELRKSMLLNNLRSSQLLVKIKDQGFSEGLSKDAIRDLIISALKDVVGLGERQIRRLMPLELKRTEMVRPQIAVMEAANPAPDPLIEKLGECITHLKTHPEQREQTILSLITLLKQELDE